jgi:hypothetical protein
MAKHRKGGKSKNRGGRTRSGSEAQASEEYDLSQVPTWAIRDELLRRSPLRSQRGDMSRREQDRGGQDTPSGRYSLLLGHGPRTGMFPSRKWLGRQAIGIADVPMVSNFEGTNVLIDEES